MVQNHVTELYLYFFWKVRIMRWLFLECVNQYVHFRDSFHCREAISVPPQCLQAIAIVVSDPACVPVLTICVE